MCPLMYCLEPIAAMLTSGCFHVADYYTIYVDSGLVSNYFPYSFSDVYIVPILKLLNIGGNVKKHLLAPWARR
jgi:hypothetical protein